MTIIEKRVIKVEVRSEETEADVLKIETTRDSVKSKVVWRQEKAMVKPRVTTINILISRRNSFRKFWPPIKNCLNLFIFPLKVAMI